MWIVLALALMLAIGDPAAAQTQSFFLHHSDIPVPIPGGTTSSFLDTLAPTAATPVAQEQIIPSGNTASFFTFTTSPFASDSTVSPIASVRLRLAANAKMKGCGAVTTQLFKVDAGGGLTSIGSASVTGADVAQGSSSGTVGATTHLLEFPISDTSVLTGEGIALATSVTNQCNINRRVFFAYDGTTAPARVRFQCCLSVAAKCSSVKMKVIATLATCLLGYDGSATAHGEVTAIDHLMKCLDKAATAFAKAEARGGCITEGDSPPRLAAAQSFANGLGATLDPVGPPHKSKCQGAKLKLAGKTAAYLLGVEAKASKAGQFLEPDLTAAGKCRNKLTRGFEKLEAKSGNDCDTATDAAATMAAIGTFETETVSALACPCEP